MFIILTYTEAINKYDFLAIIHLQLYTNWNILSLKEPNFYFVQKDFKREDLDTKLDFKLSELFPVFNQWN